MPFYESEDYLVQQAIERNRQAFGALYDSSLDRVYRHVFYRVSNQADAEDITQEVYVRAWKAIHRYKTTGAPFTAWLLSIAGNLIIDYYRKRQKHSQISEDLKEAPLESVPTPQEQAEINLDRTLLKEKVLRLKGDKQKVILMRFIDDRSVEEIATILKKTENAIRVIQFRALSDLRKMIERG